MGTEVGGREGGGGRGKGAVLVFLFVAEVIDGEYISIQNVSNFN